MTKGSGRKNAVVLIPIYKESMTDSETFSFKNTLTVLAKYDCCIIVPHRLRSYLHSLKNRTQLDFIIEYFQDHFFSSIESYNNLLTSPDFYLRFVRYQYMLIAQTDTLVFSDQLEQWCKKSYSYIGAPWLKGLTRPIQPLSLLAVGNGGFSLRNIHDFLAILSSPKYRPPVNGKITLNFFEIFHLIRFVVHCLKFSRSYPPICLKVNEDIFWGVVVPTRCKSFTVPKPEDALFFAFEAAPEYLFELSGNQLPFGCHAWERYNLPFWRDTLKKTGMELP